MRNLSHVLGFLIPPVFYRNRSSAELTFYKIAICDLETRVPEKGGGVVDPAAKDLVSSITNMG